ncbi:MAG TPA: MarR family transcriptional regulator [Planctomycetota bacterium]|nr:MarR family transcriptional regulator [Planctomycetota bacterium]
MGRILMRRLRQTKPFPTQAEESLVNLLLAGAWLRDRLDRALAPLGLTHVQYNVLRILRGAPDGLPRREIACRLIDRAPDVTRLVDRLARSGLVSRSPGRRDRRQAVARLTPRGGDLTARGDQAVDAVLRAVAQRAAREDLVTLSRVCESIYGSDEPE